MITQEEIINLEKELNNKPFLTDKKEIINWINNNSLISKEDHMEYMKREIKRALECIKTKKEYIQD